MYSLNNTCNTVCSHVRLKQLPGVWNGSAQSQPAHYSSFFSTSPIGQVEKDIAQALPDVK